MEPVRLDAYTFKSDASLRQRPYNTLYGTYSAFALVWMLYTDAHAHRLRSILDSNLLILPQLRICFQWPCANPTRMNGPSVTSLAAKGRSILIQVQGFHHAHSSLGHVTYATYYNLSQSRTAMISYMLATSLLRITRFLCFYRFLRHSESRCYSPVKPSLSSQAHQSSLEYGPGERL